MSWSKSLLVICKVLRMFVNILTADNKYSVLDRDNLRHPIQCKYLRNKNHFLNMFLNVSKKKMTLIADVFPKLWTPKSVVKQISKKYRFRGRFDKQHAKGDQTLLKSEPHNLYHIYCSMWRQLSWKNSLLVKCKVLRMFINIRLPMTNILFLRETI